MMSGSPVDAADPGELAALEADAVGAAEFGGDHAADRHQLNVEPVGLGLPGLVGTKQPAGTGLVAHDHVRRAEFVTHKLGDHAPINVEAAAGRERDDELDGLALEECTSIIRLRIAGGTGHDGNGTQPVAARTGASFDGIS